MILTFIRKWALPLGLAIVLIFCVGVLALTAISSISAHQIAQQNRALTAKIYTLQQEHQSDLETIKVEGADIQQYAQELQKEIAANHSAGVSNQKVICSSIPFCNPALIK